MVEISLCMIVKNEEDKLEKCLDSVKDLMDEIIIVDTGSSDDTKKIAAKYTDKIYDFEWTGSFSDARNFSFSKATKEYIYSADADEEIDEENRERFRILKENLLPEIEIVQMYYANQLENGTIYNYDRELRPKLFRRLRTFTWIEDVHETVRLDPVVFDSDIEIIHRPSVSHTSRDLEALRALSGKGRLSARLEHIYAQELYISGGEEDFVAAGPYFDMIALATDLPADRRLEAACVAMHCARIRKDNTDFLTFSVAALTTGMCSEACYEMGLYYEERGNNKFAAEWYQNGAVDFQAFLSVKVVEFCERRARLLTGAEN
ncbi:MAG: glycosyltransferase family 2 protein [Lachnospiraceae bacterium]|nr:glycosyltransferase family 2 protein [Lachnospiraceae bacterium]